MVKVGLDHGRCNGGTDGDGIDHHDQPPESSVVIKSQAYCGPNGSIGRMSLLKRVYGHRGGWTGYISGLWCEGAPKIRGESDCVSSLSKTSQ